MKKKKLATLFGGALGIKPYLCIALTVLGAFPAVAADWIHLPAKVLISTICVSMVTHESV